MLLASPFTRDRVSQGEKSFDNCDNSRNSDAKGKFLLDPPKDNHDLQTRQGSYTSPEDTKHNGMQHAGSPVCLAQLCWSMVSRKHASGISKRAVFSSFRYFEKPCMGEQGGSVANYLLPCRYSYTLSCMYFRNKKTRRVHESYHVQAAKVDHEQVMKFSTPCLRWTNTRR